MLQHKTIWTIGHSTRPVDEFINLLQSFGITLLADIRGYPGSKRYPQYNKNQLEQLLSATGIKYIHCINLGGWRKPRPDSHNTAWKNNAFKGYADYMETEEFKRAIIELENIASKQPTAYMCSEAVWWGCHRSLVSDYLKLSGWTVLHIMGPRNTTEHPYTQPARIENGKLTYS